MTNQEEDSVITQLASTIEEMVYRWAIVDVDSNQHLAGRKTRVRTELTREGIEIYLDTQVSWLPDKNRTICVVLEDRHGRSLITIGQDIAVAEHIKFEWSTDA